MYGTPYIDYRGTVGLNPETGMEAVRFFHQLQFTRVTGNVNPRLAESFYHVPTYIYIFDNRYESVII